jgi:hypothetical protein
MVSAGDREVATENRHAVNSGKALNTDYRLSPGGLGSPAAAAISRSSSSSFGSPAN